MEEDPHHASVSSTAVPVHMATHPTEAESEQAVATVAAVALINGCPEGEGEEEVETQTISLTNGRTTNPHTTNNGVTATSGGGGGDATGGETDDVERGVLGIVSSVDPRITPSTSSLPVVHSLEAVDPVIADLLPVATVTEEVTAPPPQPPVKKKRKTYTSEEERRKARILKNRRTAEESRQRRVKKMKELEEFVASAAVREKSLQEELRIAQEQLDNVTESLRRVVQEKDEVIALKDAEIQRLQDKLHMK